MGLQKGQTNNPNGRPKGANNRIGSDLREKLIEFAAKDFNRFLKDLRGLSPRLRVEYYIQILSFCLPKLKQVDNQTNISFDQFSEENLNTIINGIINNTSDE